MSVDPTTPCSHYAHTFNTSGRTLARIKSFRCGTAKVQVPQPLPWQPTENPAFLPHPPAPLPQAGTARAGVAASMKRGLASGFQPMPAAAREVARRARSMRQ